MIHCFIDASGRLSISHTRDKALREAEVAAKRAGVELQLLEARAPSEFDAAFAAIDREGTRSLLILLDPVFSKIIYDRTP